MNLEEFARFIQPIYNPWLLKGPNYEFARYLTRVKRFKFADGSVATWDDNENGGVFCFFPPVTHDLDDLEDFLLLADELV